MNPVGPYTFEIGDTSNLSAYNSGGYAVQVKQPKMMCFVSACTVLPLVSPLSSDVLCGSERPADRPATAGLCHLRFRQDGQNGTAPYWLPSLACLPRPLQFLPSSREQGWPHVQWQCNGADTFAACLGARHTAACHCRGDQPSIFRTGDN